MTHPLSPLCLPSMGRRSFLASAALLPLASRLLGQTRDYTPGANPARYPDPDIVTLDKRFKKYALGNTPIRRLHTGMLWAEGPAWSGVGKFLLWSDIPNDIQLRWLDDDGHVSVFRKPAGYSNGNTFDFQGRQIAFEHGNRRVVRYEHTGKATVLADTFEGKRFNAPNDGAAHPDGSLWFTDPGYGSLMHYEGHKDPSDSKQPTMKEAIYRVDPSGKIAKVTDEPFKPNGLCFSPDFKTLYVADTGKSHYEEAKNIIWAFDVQGGGKVSKGRAFASMELELNGKVVSGFADGIRCDTDGNVWSSAGWVGDGYDGVHIFAPDGVRIGQIRLPEICGNVCFGGPKRNRLFMTASQSLYAVYVEAIGAGAS